MVCCDVVERFFDVVSEYDGNDGDSIYLLMDEGNNGIDWND